MDDHEIILTATLLLLIRDCCTAQWSPVPTACFLLFCQTVALLSSIHIQQAGITIGLSRSLVTHTGSLRNELLSNSYGLNVLSWYNSQCQRSDVGLP